MMPNPVDMMIVVVASFIAPHLIDEFIGSDLHACAPVSSDFIILYWRKAGGVP